MSAQRLSNLILRAGVAFAFLYPAINALFDPHTWLGYIPSIVRGFVPDRVFLHGFGVLEVVIALWILSGRKIFLPCAAGVLILLAIVVLDFQEFQVVFRDLSIAAAAAALALDARSSRRKV